MSLSGANADVRVGIKPSQTGAAVTNLYNAIATKAGMPALNTNKVSFEKSIANTAEALWASKGKCLVVCGANDTNIQSLVNGINYMLGNYGTTIDMANPLNLAQGNDKEFVSLVSEMKEGKVAVLIMLNCNPVYTAPKALGFEAALAKVQTTISTSDRIDETSSKCKYICPDNHYLESWSDASPKANSYALIQPTIYPLFNTRSFGDSMLTWMKSSIKRCDLIIKEYLKK
jgi:molybdopterin-containing oxidoreductase family iron-sulfur binding subunit